MWPEICEHREGKSLALRPYALGMARVVGQSLGAVVVAFLLSAAPINGVGHGFQIAAVTALFGAVMSGSRVRRRPAEPDKEVEAV